MTIFGYAVGGMMLGGLIGFALGDPIGSLFSSPPRNDPIHAIWMLVGAFWGAFAGFVGGMLYGAFRLDSNKK